MFLSKHSNGRYYIYFTNSKGKKNSKSTGTRTKKEALIYLSRFRVQYLEKQNQPFIPIALKTFFFNYLRSMEPYYTNKTMEGYKNSFKFIRNYFGDIMLNDLTTTKIEVYLSDRIRKTSIFAARKDLLTLSSALNRAVRDNYLLVSPCKGIKRIKLPERQPLFYTREDFQKLIAAIDDEDIRDLTIFTVNTGLRLMEVLTLEWSKINFNERMFLLDNQTYLTKGKRVRTIPLNETAFNILLKRYERRSLEQKFIFTYKGEQIRAKWFSVFFKKFVIRSAVHPKLNFHSLRHTFASWLVQNGVSIYVISKLLGHADIKTTEIYAHLRRDDLKQAVDHLPNINF